MKTLSKTLLITMLSLAPTAALAGHGGAGPGGGNVCALNHQLRILDLMNVVSPMEASFRGVNSNQIQTDRALDSLGLTETDVKSNFENAFEQIVAQLQHQGLQKESKLLKDAFDGLVTFATNIAYQKSYAASFEGLYPCNEQNTRAVIIYNKSIGVVISQPLWNKLDGFNQFALLVHEALRNIQLRYSGAFSNQALQQTVKAIFSNDWSAVENSQVFNNIHSSQNAIVATQQKLCSKNNRLASVLLKLESKWTSVCSQPTFQNIESLWFATLNNFDDGMQQVKNNNEATTLEHFYSDSETIYLQKVADSFQENNPLVLDTTVSINLVPLRTLISSANSGDSVSSKEKNIVRQLLNIVMNE